MKESKYKGLCAKLVAHLKEKGIKDQKVLNAISSTPRHLLFDLVFRDKFAYQDLAFPIGENQTISQPYTVAFQSELLDVKRGDNILEIEYENIVKKYNKYDILQLELYLIHNEDIMENKIKIKIL